MTSETPITKNINEYTDQPSADLTGMGKSSADLWAEEEEQVVWVEEFSHNGVDYLKSFDGILYIPTSHDEVGVWNEETQTITPIEFEVDEYVESQDEEDEEDFHVANAELEDSDDEDGLHVANAEQAKYSGYEEDEERVKNPLASASFKLHANDAKTLQRIVKLKLKEDELNKKEEELKKKEEELKKKEEELKKDVALERRKISDMREKSLNWLKRKEKVTDDKITKERVRLASLKTVINDRVSDIKKKMHGLQELLNQPVVEGIDDAVLRANNWGDEFMSLDPL